MQRKVLREKITFYSEKYHFVKRLMRAMVLFNQIVEICDLSQCTAFRKMPFRFQFSERIGVGCVFVQHS